MKKRLISIFLILMLLQGLFPAGVLARDTETVFQDTFDGKTYDVIRGKYFAESSDLETKGYYYLPFYYSDGYFAESATVYNAHLATASANLAVAATYRSNFEGTYMDYRERQTVIRQVLSSIGCSDASVYINDEALEKPTENSIGFAIASKKLVYADGTETGYTLIPVAVRGGGYEAEWCSNFLLGKESTIAGGEAKGFAEATAKVMDGIREYLEAYGLTNDAKNGKVKFWLTGVSRGGAVANMAAKRLVDQFGTEAVYAYPLEPAAGGNAKAEKTGVSYDCIHNLVNSGDIVPKVAPAQMGFKLYGQTVKYVPEDATT